MTTSTTSTTSRKGNGANGAAAPQTSIFDDAEALKRATAAKLSGRRAADGTPELVLGKPRKTWIFRTPADESLLFAGTVWEDPDTQTTYFVHPDLWDLDDFDGALKPVLFVPYVTAALEGVPAVHGVWPVSTTPGNTYCDTAQEIVKKSRRLWVRMWSNNLKKIYRWKPSDKDYGEPKFLEMTIFEQLKILFGGKKEILGEDHPVIQRLR